MINAYGRMAVSGHAYKGSGPKEQAGGSLAPLRTPFSLLCSLAAAILLMVQAPPVRSQYFVRGQAPSSVRWQYIDTPNFRLIFPDDYSERAAYVADILEHAYVPASTSLDHQPRRVPVILHNRTVVPNGFVSWAPARIEMFSNPPPGNDPHNWMERLAVHEFRHVVQVDKINQGVTGLMARIFGEHVTGLALGLFVPLWLLEGDAVVAETALTHAGRGRQPSFEQGLRAQVMEKGAYSYDKAMLGSLKDHVPNHYELGYQLVASARAGYGAGIWGKVFDQVGRRPYSLFPVSVGLRRHTGHNVRSFYERSFERLDSLWSKQAEQHEYTTHQVFSPEKTLYTHYRPIAFCGHDALLVLKTGMEDIPRIARLDRDGVEKRVFTPGFYNSDVISAGGGLLAWSEIRPDPRWEHRSWSEIHLYDLEEGRHRRITRGTRFFSPAVSPDGSRVAVTEVTARDEYALVIIDASTGEEKWRVPSPGNAFLMHPHWHPGGRLVSAIAQDAAGKRILSFDPEDGLADTLFDAGHTDISRPRYLDAGTIAFNGAFSGIDNIYVLDVESGKVSQLISSRFGAVDLVVDRETGRLAWSDYSSMGYQAVVPEDESPAGLPLEEIQDHSVGFHQVLAEQEGHVVDSRHIVRQPREVRDYKRGAHLLNIHSWGPFAVEVSNMDVRPGLSVFSQNHLSTSVLSAGYEWDINERLGKYYVSHSYFGRYPVFEFSAESGQRRSYYVDQGSPDELIPFLWRERAVRMRTSVPLRFRRGPVMYGVTPSVRLGVTSVGVTRDSPDFFESNEVFPFEYRLLAYRQYRSVVRDIRPRFAQVVDLQYRHTPFPGGDMGYVMAVRFIGYFPGLVRHHSLRLVAAYQEQERGEPRQFTVNYSFPSLIQYPRGHHHRYDISVCSFSADYAFPLAYPDWALPSVLYVKRLHLNLFGDYARADRMMFPGEGSPYMAREEMTSLGADLVFHVHLFRFFSPLDLGLRTIYLPDDGEVLWRLLLAFDL